MSSPGNAPSRASTMEHGDFHSHGLPSSWKIDDLRGNCTPILANIHIHNITYIYIMK